MDKNTQKSKLSVLQEIMDMMAHRSGKSLAGLKKKPVAAEISMTAIKPEMDDSEKEPKLPLDNSEDESSDSDEPSDEEKAQIAALYKKYFQK